MKVTGLHVFLIISDNSILLVFRKRKKNCYRRATGSMAAHKLHRRNDIKRLKTK